MLGEEDKRLEGEGEEGEVKRGQGGGGRKAGK